MQTEMVDLFVNHLTPIRMRKTEVLEADDNLDVSTMGSKVKNGVRRRLPGRSKCCRKKSDANNSAAEAKQGGGFQAVSRLRNMKYIFLAKLPYFDEIPTLPNVNGPFGREFFEASF
jgi:hypothetical protein